MAIDIDKMKQKLNTLQGKDASKNVFWRPNDGESNLRIVPTSDGDPFKERWFHYNFGDTCPVCDFGNKLWNEGTEESKKMAKDMFAKQRFFSPVLIRGEEAEGVKVWGYGKTAYQKLLNIVLDPDYGDITDPDDGNDLKIMYGKSPGASFPTTDIRPRPRKSVLCDENTGGEERCAELLETVPDFETLFERKSTEETGQLLDSFLSTDTENGQMERFGNNNTTTTNPVDTVDAAFKDLLNS